MKYGWELWSEEHHSWEQQAEWFPSATAAARWLARRSFKGARVISLAQGEQHESSGDLRLRESLAASDVADLDKQFQG